MIVILIYITECCRKKAKEQFLKVLIFIGKLCFARAEVPETAVAVIEAPELRGHKKNLKVPFPGTSAIVTFLGM